MPEANNWRLFLFQLFEQDPKLARRIAGEIGVKPITLLRWARSEASPHHPVQALRQVSQAESFRAYAEEFLRLAAEEFPTISALIDEGGPREVPSTFYRDLLITVTTINDDLLFWTLAHQISQQVSLLMGAKQELVVTIFLLTPPGHDQQVRSLYTPSDQGKNSVYPTLHYYPTLLGAESPITQALLMREPLLLTEETQDIAAVALQKRGRVAGLLVLHSLQPGFLTPRRLILAADIARPLSLGLPEWQFYPPLSISLAILPSRQEQEQCQRETPFVHRIRSVRMRREGSQSELEREALQELEEALVFLSKANQGAKTT